MPHFGAMDLIEVTQVCKTRKHDFQVDYFGNDKIPGLLNRPIGEVFSMSTLSLFFVELLYITN